MRDYIKRQTLQAGWDRHYVTKGQARARAKAEVQRAKAKGTN